MNCNCLKSAKRGTIYLLLSSFIIAILFFLFLFTNVDNSFMSEAGWCYYVIACLSHSFIMAVIPYLLLFLPITLLTKREVLAAGIYCGVLSIMMCLFLLDYDVYGLYRFHINGFVIGMALGTGASEIFDFGTALYVKAAVVVLLIILFNIALLRLSGIIATHISGKKVLISYISVLLLMTLGVNGVHAYASAAGSQSVIRSSEFIPYYYPLSANKLILKLGLVSESDYLSPDMGSKGSQYVEYPKHPIKETGINGKPMNVIIIAIDAWNKRSLTPKVMPNTYAFSQKCECYNNHFSSSNGTRGGIFGLFYGIPSTYWKDFDVTHTYPVLIHELLHHGYQVQTYPSATLLSPPFARNVFKEVPNLNIEGHGKTTYDRDCDVTRRLLADLDKNDGKKPFFSFIFYDLNHSIRLTKDKLYRFQPSWDYAHYTELNNNSDPTLFWNLYCNCSAEVDSLAGLIYKKLEQKGLLDNTIVMITGDHGQEFNENHKNYWGHNSNFSKIQIGVPFLFYYPGCKHTDVAYRTTHYDVTATLLPMLFGVTNPSSDFSFGHPLHDATPRTWHVAGSDINTAFIVDKDVIIEQKSTGYMEITDAHLNPINNYKINAVELNKAIQHLHYFYK